MSLVCYSLAHASESSDAVKAPTADDQKVVLPCGCDEHLDRLSIFEANVVRDRIDCGLVEALSIAHGQKLSLDLEPICENTTDGYCRGRLDGAVDPDHDRAG
jgi:hypothetical protein